MAANNQTVTVTDATWVHVSKVPGGPERLADALTGEVIALTTNDEPAPIYIHRDILKRFAPKAYREFEEALPLENGLAAPLDIPGTLNNLRTFMVYAYNGNLQYENVVGSQAWKCELLELWGVAHNIGSRALQAQMMTQVYKLYVAADMGFITPTVVRDVLVDVWGNCEPSLPQFLVGVVALGLNNWLQLGEEEGRAEAVITWAQVFAEYDTFRALVEYRRGLPRAQQELILSDQGAYVKIAKVGVYVDGGHAGEICVPGHGN